jgi:AbiV family abortive infection protein
MSNFLNLSPRHSKCLHEPIFKNALKLKKDAITLAERNASYSTANSLLILSSEEMIKALLVLLHSEGYHVYRIEVAEKFFN